MKNLQNTHTAKNLLLAFAGESQARNRYSYYSEVAEQEGYIQIKEVFTKTADNEKEHAQRFYNFLLEGLGSDIPTNLSITGDFPIAKGTTLDNLYESSKGEHKEANEIYPFFAKVAEEEGFTDVANAFKSIAIAETAHEARYKKLYDNLKNDEVFKKSKTVIWHCINCGYIHEGVSAVKTCPSCLKPQDYYELFVEKF